MKGNSETVGAAPLTARQIYMFVVLALVYACHLVDRTILLVLMEPIKHEFGLTDTQLGLLSGPAFAIGTVLAALPLGSLADRRSRKSLLSLCIAAWSVMTLMGGFVTGFISLLVLRFSVGAAEAGLQPTALSMAADASSSVQRSKAVAIIHVGIPLGTLIGFVAGGWAAAHLGWRQALLLVGTPGLALAALVWLTVAEPRRQVEAGEGQGSVSLGRFFVELWHEKPLLHVIVGLVLLWLCTSSTSAWMAPFLARVHNQPIAVIGLIMAGSTGIGGMIGNALSGTLVQKLAGGRRDRLALIAAGSAFIYCPLGFVTYLAPSIYLSVTTLTLQSIFYFMIFTPGYSLAMDIADARIRARTAALVSMGATAIGYGLGPQIVGVLSDRFSTFAGAASLRYALVVMTLVALWSGAHFLQAWRKLRPIPDTQ